MLLESSAEVRRICSEGEPASPLRSTANSLRSPSREDSLVAESMRTCSRWPFSSLLKSSMAASAAAVACSKGLVLWRPSDGLGSPGAQSPASLASVVCAAPISFLSAATCPLSSCCSVISCLSSASAAFCSLRSSSSLCASRSSKAARSADCCSARSRRRSKIDDCCSFCSVSRRLLMRSSRIDMSLRMPEAVWLSSCSKVASRL
mmetsp:Transcript_123677/g.361158  ORF Transcript_123677/g.361158 Transcript_123677/m.361158 type:complete len:205 (-) Transcript_123677:200-814(-)